MIPGIPRLAAVALQSMSLLSSSFLPVSLSSHVHLLPVSLSCSYKDTSRVGTGVLCSAWYIDNRDYRERWRGGLTRSMQTTGPPFHLQRSVKSERSLILSGGMAALWASPLILLGNCNTSFLSFIFIGCSSFKIVQWCLFL